MTDELDGSRQLPNSRKSRGVANQSILFPDPATELKDNHELTLGEGRKKRTFSVYPQEGSSGFPLVEYTSLEKPLSCTVVMSFACVVMIHGWIWGGKPL
jgi:hypothetical protein